MGDTYYYVQSLAISGNNIFAGVERQGVYLSTNNGSSWSAVNNGLSGIGLDVTSLAVDGSKIFAGTSGEGIYMTSNNGGNWIETNTGLTNNPILSLAANGANLFAVNGISVFLSTNKGVVGLR